MDMQLIKRHFGQMGARVRCDSRRSAISRGTSAVTINVVQDPRGELFELERARDKTARVSVIDIAPRDRHLLLRVDESRFLCGHDERHWFVAAVPEAARATNVLAAKEALMPEEVRDALERTRVKRRDRHRRRNAAFVRQGEWFFIPDISVRVNQHLVLLNEPISRGRGKAHWVQFLYRSGGQTVYVSRVAPGGLSEKAYREWRDTSEPELVAGVRWRVMQREATVYARGTVRHPDHATVRLDGWHRVAMNTESKAAAMRHVVFLD